jgi:hypothetical protein
MTLLLPDQHVEPMLLLPTMGCLLPASAATCCSCSCEIVSNWCGWLVGGGWRVHVVIWILQNKDPKVAPFEAHSEFCFNAIRRNPAHPHVL